MTALLEMTREELQNTFQAEVSAKLDYRWKESTLVAKIEEARENAAVAAKQKAEREEKERVAEEMRQARIAARGDFATFAKEFRRSERDDYAALARAVGWAQRVLEQHEKTTAEMAEKFAKDPAYAMSWSMGYFEHAANYSVAQDLKRMFEGGATVKGMIDHTNRAVRQKAVYPARSTSPVSNLMEQEQLRAMTKLLGYLDGSEYF